MDDIKKAINNERAWDTKVVGKVLQFGNSGKQPEIWKKRSRRGNWRKRCATEFYSIPATQSLAFSDFNDLHELWTSYIVALLGPTSGWKNISNLLPTLVRADYHGCVVRVERSKIPSLIGIEGIVLKENKTTFEILTKTADKLKSMSAGIVFF
jgi:hypothetical protein